MCKEFSRKKCDMITLTQIQNPFLICLQSIFYQFWAVTILEKTFPQIFPFFLREFSKVFVPNFRNSLINLHISMDR